MSRKDCKLVTAETITTSESLWQSRAIRETARAFIIEDPDISFDSVVSKTMEFWNDGPNKVTQEAVHSAMAGITESRRKKDLEGAKKQIALIEKQATLLAKIERMISRGLEVKKGKPALTNNEILRLQGLLNELRENARATIRNVATLENVNREIALMEEHITNGTFPKKKPSKRKVPAPDVKAARKDLNKIIKRLKTRAARDSLIKQIESGEIETVSRSSDIVDEESLTAEEKALFREEFDIDKEIRALKREANDIIKKREFKEKGVGAKILTVVKNAIGELVNFPKALVLSGDLPSAIFRQFGFFAPDWRFWINISGRGNRSPILKNFYIGVIKSLSEASAAQVWKVHQQSEGFIDAVQHGLEQNSPTAEVTVGEEQYESWLIDKFGKWLGIKFVADVSQRTYRALLNGLTLDAYRIFTKGMTLESDKKETADWINSIVGRGQRSKQLISTINRLAGMDAAGLGSLAPRYMLSGFESFWIEGKNILTGSNAMRLAIARSWANYLMAGATLNLLMEIFMDADPDDDPESNTYQTVWFGDFNVNVWGNRFMPAKLMWQYIYGLKLAIWNDDKQLFNNASIWNYIENRPSMLIRIIRNEVKEEDFGEPWPRITTEFFPNILEGDLEAVAENTGIYIKHFTPLAAQNTLKAWNDDENVWTAAITMTLEQAGISGGIRERKK